MQENVQVPVRVQDTRVFRCAEPGCEAKVSWGVDVESEDTRVGCEYMRCCEWCETTYCDNHEEVMKLIRTPSRPNRITTLCLACYKKVEPEVQEGEWRNCETVK